MQEIINHQASLMLKIRLRKELVTPKFSLEGVEVNCASGEIRSTYKPIYKYCESKIIQDILHVNFSVSVVFCSGFKPNRRTGLADWCLTVIFLSSFVKTAAEATSIYFDKYFK